MLLSLLVCVVSISLPVHAMDCSRDEPDYLDCFTAFSDCVLITSDYPHGESGVLIPNSAPNTQSHYRTCRIGFFRCGATIERDMKNLPIRKINSVGDNGALQSTLWIIQSENFDEENPQYVKNTISRFNIECDDNKQIQYSFATHHLEESVDCLDMPTCVDYLRLDFPTYNEDLISCGTMNKLNTTIGLDGMPRLNAEFVTNRAEERPGFSMFVYCRNPAFDAHHVLGYKRRRSIDTCTSPNGIGLRNEAFDPRPAERILELMNKDGAAQFMMLEVGETLMYINNTVFLSNGASFPNIMCLTVENRIQTKTISGSSTGSYGGFAQVSISVQEQKAVMVQFGVRPIFQPTEEEITFIGMLENGILKQLTFDDEQTEQFLDIEDEIDVFPRFNIQIPRSRRGVDTSFLDEVAMEFGNACNGALRSAACHYQDLVMGRNCLENA